MRAATVASVNAAIVSMASASGGGHHAVACAGPRRAGAHPSREWRAADEAEQAAALAAANAAVDDKAARLLARNARGRLRLSRLRLPPPSPPALIDPSPRAQACQQQVGRAAGRLLAWHRPHRLGSARLACPVLGYNRSLKADERLGRRRRLGEAEQEHEPSPRVRADGSAGERA